VGAKSLATFEKQFIFCNDVATRFGRSSRAVASFLKKQGVHPVAGPGVDDCRQLLFDRISVDVAMTLLAST
jgi:hypothetical protein